MIRQENVRSAQWNTTKQPKDELGLYYTEVSYGRQGALEFQINS